MGVPVRSDIAAPIRSVVPPVVTHPQVSPVVIRPVASRVAIRLVASQGGTEVAEATDKTDGE